MRDSSETFKKYRHYQDNRSPSEIEGANQTVRQLTNINLARVERGFNSSRSVKSLHKEDFLYVCLPGLPPYEQEFSRLDLPGQYFQYVFTLSRRGLKAERQSNSWADESRMLHEEINSRSTIKPIVFVYHSFGTFILIQYFKYYSSSRVVGLIDLGGVPIRFYPFLKTLHETYAQLDWQFVVDNIDAITNRFNEAASKVNSNYSLSSQQHLGLLKTVFSPDFGFKEMFEEHRNFPAILKCIIFGRKDGFFLEKNLSEKALFFSKQPFSPAYQCSLEQAYKTLEGKSASNIQEQFIFNISEAKHSLHLQKAFLEIIRKIIGNYLTFIEEVHAQQHPSL